MNKKHLLTILCAIFFVIEIVSADDSDLYGCYVSDENTFKDKICLMTEGKYEQFYFDKNNVEIRFNNSTWRSYQTGDEQDKETAIALKGFIRKFGIDDHYLTSEMDVWLKKGNDGKPFFTISRQWEKRKYIKE